MSSGKKTKRTHVDDKVGKLAEEKPEMALNHSGVGEVDLRTRLNSGEIGRMCRNEKDHAHIELRQGGPRTRTVF